MKNSKLAALRAAFPYTVPIFAGFWFVVIFMEQWMKERRHLSEFVGFLAAVCCRLVFGADNFLIPTMVCILACLSFLKKPIESKFGGERL